MDRRKAEGNVKSIFFWQVVALSSLGVGRERAGSISAAVSPIRWFETSLACPFLVSV